ncbi:MAG: S8 family peptidase [bacterium]|nr:S8 family peptidase [bacterium]
MGKIKIGLIILGSIALVGLVVAGVVMADSQLKVGNSNNGKVEYVADEIIVKFKGDKEPFRVLKVPEGKVGEKVKEFKKRADVIYAEPNYIAYALMAPNDPYYKYQWHLDNPVYGGIQMKKAWDISTGTNSVVVAIVDTGIAYENYGKYCQAPDLAQTCFVSGYDFVYNDTHPNDDNNHGTHVAGTVAQSTNNNLGVAGVAFNTCLMPVKVLDSSGSGSYTQVADGIYYAANNGAKVINLSLGGSSDSATLKEAVAYAYQNGVTVIAACGNDNKPNCLYPAAYNDYVIAVGATQYDEKKAPYSNYGLSLDLVAPGGNTSLDQNKDGYADGVLQQTFASSGQLCSFAFYFFQGTSMAAPHISGVAALLIANGNADADKDGITSPQEVRNVLQSTAEDKGATSRDNTYGWGLVDAYAALSWTAEPDTDGDGIIDSKDACPTIAGTYCNGCPKPTCSGCQSAICPATGAPICVDDNSKCTVPNAVGTCSTGVCSYVCNTGYDNCDENWANGCEANLATDSNNCGVCNNTCGTSTCPESGCGVGGCTIEEYGTYPTEQQTACVKSVCSGECAATCAYDAACDPDDDNDEVLDINDACPTVAGTACNGCPNPCSGCAAMSCNAETLNPPTCGAGTCPDTACPANGCGVDTCVPNEYGTYIPISNTCNIVDNVGTCENNSCTLTCAYDLKCEAPPAVKCWSKDYQYLYKASDQAKKFCKCAQSSYGYNSYKLSIGAKTTGKYVDIGDNTVWSATSVFSRNPISSVTCTDGRAYPTNVDYTYPK